MPPSDRPLARRTHDKDPRPDRPGLPAPGLPADRRQRGGLYGGRCPAGADARGVGPARRQGLRQQCRSPKDRGTGRCSRVLTSFQDDVTGRPQPPYFFQVRRFHRCHPLCRSSAQSTAAHDSQRSVNSFFTAPANRWPSDRAGHRNDGSRRETRTSRRVNMGTPALTGTFAALLLWLGWSHLRASLFSFYTSGGFGPEISAFADVA